MRIPPPLLVDPDDRTTLRGWVEDATVGEAGTRRARIVLLTAQGYGPSAVADELHCSKQTVITWRERYREFGVAGLRDAPRSGRPATVDTTAVVLRTLQPPTAGIARWSTRLLAAELGISNVAVANVWRAWGIRPGPAGRVSLSTTPVLDAAVRVVAGVHIDPPVQVMALLVTDAGRVEDQIAVPSRPGIGARFTEFDAGAGSEDGGGGLKEFLDRLDDRYAEGLYSDPQRSDPQRYGDGSARLALLASAPAEALDRWVLERPDVVLHVVPAGIVWARPARVACLLAGATRPGAASVEALQEAMQRHPGGRPFSWENSIADSVQ